jgi:hypothetical protein
MWVTGFDREIEKWGSFDGGSSAHLYPQPARCFPQRPTGE